MNNHITNHTATPSKGLVWVVDDDSSIRWVLQKALTNEGVHCQCFDNAKKLLVSLTSELSEPDVIISDIKMPEVDGLTLLNHIQNTHPHIPTIIITAHSDLDAAVSSYQKGAFDYIPKPFDIDEMLHLVERAIRKNKKNIIPNEIKAQNSTGIIGEAPAMQEVFRIIGRLSKSSMSVLINGESGTGKELIAKALHLHSPRADAPFIALNMAAIPNELIESELFGHEKGAFTGANQIRHGRFEQANFGTLFLDEIGDMPLDIQTRLLRVLADGQFYRVGGHQPVKVDVRIIAATHQNLEQLVQAGKFRDDLFHRLNVIRIHLPPLRERAEDIPTLTRHFLQTTAKELESEPKILTKEVLDILCRFSWPGNVRQLENICRWLTIMSSSQEILPQDLPIELAQVATAQLGIAKISNEQSPLTGNTPATEQTWQHLLDAWAKTALSSGKSNILLEVTDNVERILLKCALEFTHGHKQEAAHLLGWGRNTLTRKLKELNMTK